VTNIRHVRDEDWDGEMTAGDKLLARYAYEYDANSMMRYEARWFNDDSDGASTTPDEVDFYWHDKQNQLVKATYNATSMNLSSLNWTNIEANNIAHTDRQVFDRRRTGTIEHVNWYRGSTPLASLPDDTTAPQQTTDYDTDEDDTKAPGTPAAAGAGSRLEYSEIGQVQFDYDYNNNLLEDATRTFTYNFRNEVRRINRKSDGDDIAVYRRDAIGRRVLTAAAWEVAATKRFDTRFELDVNVDSDSNATDMNYSDGGSTANVISYSSFEEAQWLAKIQPTDFNDQEYYADHAVLIPEVGSATYFGYLQFDVFQLRIYDNRYELWEDGGLSALSTSSTMTTAGYRNIGISISHLTSSNVIDIEVYVDGTSVAGSSFSGNLTNALISRFATRSRSAYFSGDDYNGLELLEYISYVRSFYRNTAETTGAPGYGNRGPQTSGGRNPNDVTDLNPGNRNFTGTAVSTYPTLSTCAFDAIQLVDVVEISDNGTTHDTNPTFEQDGNPEEFRRNGEEIDALVNGRRTAGVYISGGVDHFDGGGETVGVIAIGVTNACGGFTIYDCPVTGGQITELDNTLDHSSNNGGVSLSFVEPAPMRSDFHSSCVPTHFGGASQSPVDRATYVGELMPSPGVSNAPNGCLRDDGNCAYRGEDGSVSGMVVAKVAPALGVNHTFGEKSDEVGKDVATDGEEIGNEDNKEIALLGEPFYYRKIDGKFYRPIDIVEGCDGGLTIFWPTTEGML